jgi:hypothetical protein
MRLLTQRDEGRAEAPVDPVGFFGDDWEAARDDVEAKRAVLDDALERIVVSRPVSGGRQSKAKVLARLTFEWKESGALAFPLLIRRLEGVV